MQNDLAGLYARKIGLSGSGIMSDDELISSHSRSRWLRVLRGD